MRSFWHDALFGGPWFAGWISLFWGLAYVTLSTDVAPSVDQEIAICMFAVLVAILWLVELFRWSWKRKRTRDAERSGVASRYWLLPGLSALLILLALSGLPLRARFELSRTEFTDYAEAYLARERAGERDRLRLGSYRILEVRPVRGGAFFVTGGGMFEDAGFVYAPDAHDTSRFDRNLGGGWWTMERGAPLTFFE